MSLLKSPVSVGAVSLALAALVLLSGCATAPTLGGLTLALATGGAAGFPTPLHGSPGGGHPEPPLVCGGMAMPLGWPDFSSGAPGTLLAPFLTCSSPAEYVALQQRVDMRRLVEALDDWSAVRLSALGPMREDAVEVLHRKRVSFLLSATECYGPAYAEVLALFVLHSAHDDEVDAVLRLLARDKQLGQTLGLMPAVRAELEARGLPLSAYPERAERSGDVLRGLSRVGRDALSTTPTSDGARYMQLSALRARLPRPYQQALDEVERAQMRRHFAPGSVVLGSFDSLTFGVPLGFYYLAVGTAQGLSSLSQGHYEQATRELAPAALLVTLYAGGQGVRALSEARGAPGIGMGARGLQRLTALQELVRQWETRLGVDGVRELLREIRARREAAHFVALGGADAALALGETRGDVARAQAWLSRAKPQQAGSPAAKGSKGGSSREVAASTDEPAGSPSKQSPTERPGGMASLVDEPSGLTQEVVEAKLARVELEATGPRLSKEATVLERQSPVLDTPPPGAESSPRWGEYVAYYERRLGELKQGMAADGPLRWAAYERMWGWFTRGLAFERTMLRLLRADAELPRAARRFLRDFERPRIERYVGVKKPGSGLRFADVLVIEEGESAGRPPRVETFSFKSRDLSGLSYESLEAQIMTDARAALDYYGEALNIRRSSLKAYISGNNEVPVNKVRLIYEGGVLEPRNVNEFRAAVREVQQQVPGIEVLIQ